MSYDVYLMPAALAGADPEAAYLRLLEDEEAEAAPEAPTPELEADLRAVADELLAVDPHYELRGPFPGISYWSMQLVDERPGTALVELYPRYATAQLSYGADDTPLATERLLDCVRVFVARGFVAYDPQLERTLDPLRDAPEIQATLDHVRDEVFPPEHRGLFARLFRR